MKKKSLFKALTKAGLRLEDIKNPPESDSPWTDRKDQIRNDDELDDHSTTKRKPIHQLADEESLSLNQIHVPKKRRDGPAVMTTKSLLDLLPKDSRPIVRRNNHTMSRIGKSSIVTCSAVPTHLFR
jgi:hypothetical protein